MSRELVGRRLRDYEPETVRLTRTQDTMKRTITVTLTVALVASLLLAGFAGTAAAGSDHMDDGPSLVQDADADLWQGQDVTQVSTSDQDATAVSFGGGTATVGQSSSQSNDNTQRGEVTAENTFEHTVVITAF